MDLTLMEAAKGSAPVLNKVAARILEQNSPILRWLPFRTINGPAYQYMQEGSLGTVGYRAVGGAYTADSGVINPRVETLCDMGGEVFIDNFELETMGNLIALKPQKYEMKQRALAQFFDQEFFEGSRLVNPAGMDGMRRRIAGNQLVNMANGGGTLTLAKLNQMHDKVVGGKPTGDFMNRTITRKVTDLVAAVTGSTLITYEKGRFGTIDTMYAGIPMNVIEMDNDQSTFLDFDEAENDDGSGTANTASIYSIRFGPTFVHGISTKSLPSVRDLGESQERPGVIGRIQWFVGMASEHPRSAARLYHIDNA